MGLKKMEKIILVCNAGMSTGILAQKIEQASNNTLDVNAYSESEYLDYIDGVDLILLGPQIQFLLETIKNSVDIPVEVIDSVKYGMMNGQGVYEDIQKMMGAK